MDLYKNMSGDTNPLHWDDSYAQARQFKGRVVYGGLIVAAVSRLLGTQLPGPGCVWQSLSLQFRRPLYVDEAAEVIGLVTYSNPELRVLRMDIEVKRADDCIAEGSVQAGLAGPV